MINTGSLVSFVKKHVFERLLNSFCKITAVTCNLRNLSNERLEILGQVKVELCLRNLESKVCFVKLFVINSNAFQGDVILGRDFLSENKLILIYQPNAQCDRDRINLFSILPLCIEDENSLEQITESLEIDFDENTRGQLRQLILEVKNKDISPVEDEYSVQVQLKDTSTYAYAPRRFAYPERIRIREIR